MATAFEKLVDEINKITLYWDQKVTVKVQNGKVIFILLETYEGKRYFKDDEEPKNGKRESSTCI